MPETAESLLQFAREEIKQLAQEGCDTWELERSAKLIADEGGPDQLKRARRLVEALERLTPEDTFPYEEPSTLDEILAHRPDGPRNLAAGLDPEVLADQTLGAWLGRAAGCMLGKPVEGWPREKIADWLQVCGLDELRDYLPEPPAGSAGIDVPDWKRALLHGHIAKAARDDDTDYTIVGLRVLERHGREFTPRQVAEFWLQHLPYHCTYTAERVAYRNFVNDIWPPDSATYRNPFREWIGAQIRADAFGYVCPGRPADAAALAFKDASVSHVKNGIYGEMWVAATLAAAFVAGDPGKAMRIGLSEIPRNCRLAETVGAVMHWRDEGIDEAEATSRILGDYGDYSGVHTINNAAIVAMALLWGEMDFSRSVGLAVGAGLDTDCNGATAGSIVGAMIGAKAIPEHWVAPLNDSLDTTVAGESTLRISDLAARTGRLQSAS